MARIELLDDRVANQIAAGEVIERPASIVKELVENSLDANASHIRVLVEAGALRRIRVIDDGDGIVHDDLQLAFQRHATSKIRDARDLSQVATMGFRGEALASIAAVARVNMTSRTEGSESAWTIRVDGGKQSKFAPVAGRVGTDIDVTDLFFNTPARRKFLKQSRTEMNHVSDVVRILAATHPQCSFHLENDGRVLESLEGVESMDQRVSRILGNTFMDESIEIELERDDMKLEGWVGIPTHTRSSATRQYFFVNGRHVRDRLVAHAIKQGYQDVMFHGRHPVFLLELTLDPANVDVNVHPTKSEVRFRDSRAVHDFIMGGMYHELRDTRTTIAPHFEVDEQPRRSEPLELSQSTQGTLPLPHPELPDPFQNRGGAGVAQRGLSSSIPQHERLSSADIPPMGYALAQLQGAYILAENAEGLVIVDMHAAHERIVYERMKKARDANGINRQRLLVPLELDVSASDVQCVETARDALLEAGLDIERSGENAIKVREIPANLRSQDIKKMVLDLLVEIDEFGTIDSVREFEDRMFASMACHEAIRFNHRLSLDAMNALLREMETTPNAGQCNHGRPTYRVQSLQDLDRVFLRGR